MKLIPLVMALAFTLSGCDAAKEIGAQFVEKVSGHPVVVQPGYKMLVNGRAAQVFGKDECPPSSPDEGKRLCIVIAPETKTVPVTVVLPSGPVDEVWTVERSADRTMLRRADGSYLAAAK
ncbi:hypothetical protein [Pseudomonas sp. D3-10]|uniref:hypothetical protein n=1 Tax=Pseudomonas sp. D3-10 TaxID=2817392 RepID=UPI003DAA13B2